MQAHCWQLHPKMKPKKFNNKGKQNTVATTQQDFGSNSGDETKITTMDMKGKYTFLSLVLQTYTKKHQMKIRGQKFFM